MAYYTNVGQQAYGFYGGGTGAMPAYAPDPDLAVQGLNQRALVDKQGDIAARQQAAQQAFQGQQAGLDRAFTGSQNDANRTFQSNQQQAAGKIASDAAAQQFGYTRQLADQSNAFQQALQQAGFSQQSSLSKQEAQQTADRDASQYGYTSKLNTQQNAAAQALQQAQIAGNEQIAAGNNAATLGAAGLSAGANRYASDQQLAGQRYSSDNQLKAAQLPIDFAKYKLNTILPLLSSATSGVSGSIDLTGGGAGGTGAPTSVFSPQQISQQVNAALAGNAQRTATTNRGIAQDAAARGLSSQSPVTAALMQGAAGQQLMADNESAREIPYQAAQGNASQATAAAGLAEQARQTNVQAQLSALQIASSQRNAYLAALAGAL